jgi:uncharacterized Fe-S cluster protein YjdI
MATKIMQDTCTNEFQDKTYGKGNRVFNSKEKDKHLLGWTCTVCGHNKEVSKGDAELLKEEKKPVETAAQAATPTAKGKAVEVKGKPKEKQNKK